MGSVITLKTLTLPVSIPDHIHRKSELLQGSHHSSDSAQAAMTKRGAIAALSYMAFAVLLVMFNKAALSSYNFPCANVIALFQMFCSTLVLYVMRQWSIVSFSVGEDSSTSIVWVPLRTLYQTIPLSFSYLLYMIVSMESVRSISVPMYTSLRRTTVAFTMIMEYYLVGQRHSASVVGSVGIIILGAFIAGVWDLSFDVGAYGFVFFANICTAVYLALIARVGKSTGLTSFGLMWCNGIICGPILLLWTLIHGDYQVLMRFPYLSSRGFQVVMLLSSLMAFLLNYSVFLNTTLNSALTQTVCGNLKDLVTIGLGWQLFGGLRFDMFNVVGQIIGFVGSCIYAYCKLKGR